MLNKLNDHYNTYIRRKEVNYFGQYIKEKSMFLKNGK